jgi:O-antigen/teichoic acid export membrane protein
LEAGLQLIGEQQTARSALAKRELVRERRTPSAAGLRRWLAAARADPLTRTSGLLIGDQIALAAIGAICTVLSTRFWVPSAVGAVAAVTGPLTILVLASTLGMPSTVVRFLASETRQAALIAQALLVTGTLALIGAMLVAFVPGHLGVPVDQVGLHGLVIPLLVAVYMLASLVVAVVDPAYIARQEVSFMVAKDMAASAVRVIVLLILSASGAGGLFLVAVLYVACSAGMDLVILSGRLSRARAVSGERRLGRLRQHSSFALGSHISIVVSNVPIYILPALAAGLIGTAASAYVAIPLQLMSLLTVVPSMTGQSLLAELSRRPEDVLTPTIKALRGAYAATLPCAAFVLVAAPEVMLVFGSRYAAHGAAFLRWAAAGSVFFVFNYVSDVTLLARHKVRDYFVVNVAGTIAIMALVGVALSAGLHWLGPAWFVGQACYAALSAVVLFRRAGRARVREGARMLLPALRRS